MFEQFTDRARRVVIVAGEYASRYGSTHLTTGHLLMGLLLEGEALPVGVLDALGVAEHTATPIVRQWLEKSWTSHEGTPHPPWTEAAKLSLERSVVEAQKLDVGYVAPEHLLLGLLSVADRPMTRVDENIFTRTLVELGVSPLTVRENMLHAIQVANQAEANARLSASLDRDPAASRRQVTVEITVSDTYSVDVLEGEDDLDIMQKGLAAARRNIKQVTGTGSIIRCSARIEETDV